MSNDIPATNADTAPVEKKTWAALAGGLVVGLIGAVLNVVTDPNNRGLIEGLPMWAQFLLLTIVPGLVPFAAAYSAPHTNRTDRAARRASR
jgi:CDP-diglyceride synthetase